MVWNINTYYYPKYSKKSTSYEQRLEELKQILVATQKDFPLDSLQGILMRLLASLGDVAIDVSNDSCAISEMKKIRN